MPKYEVTFDHGLCYEVEADCEEDAHEEAVENLISDAWDIPYDTVLIDEA